ncbi:Assimilatory nitrate reductase electron transfer subunit [Acetivibrio saccincola]|uniref:Assimilatory nitrate reductase electron transfer subunit n=1 Tax=Acetivibrio saccincola TaxID=1677857 RepID=A0A2K9E8M1_9FIRM|nr:Assimilatory nitrate reductase electron transfer subunit [Acetivibrio saccincola]
MRYVILGNGAAGISAAETLRSLDELSEITIISEENVPTYTKFLLPDYVGGRLPREKLFLRSMKNYEENKINLMLNKKVDKIDVENKCIKLNCGTIVEYDKLLAATGAKPVIPKIDGLENSDYLTINTITDADIIRNRASAGKNAVIVGGGLTGVETAYALKNLGMNTTIVEREDSILPQHLDSMGSEIFINQVQEDGIDVLLSKNMVFVSSGEEKYVEFSDGEKIKYDMLVIAIGTRPCLDIFEGTEIKCQRGVLVNRYLESSVKDVYAAGDVSESQSYQARGYVSGYIWSNALTQGKCAAFNMAGQPKEFTTSEAASSAVRLRDVPLISMGLVKPDEKDFEVVVELDKESNMYKKIVLKDNKVKGMIFIGDVKTGNIIADYIRKYKDISDIKHLIFSGS